MEQNQEERLVTELTFLLFSDDYWRKFFVAEDTAMLLTDVSRSVETVANILQRSGSLPRSRNSLRKVSSTEIIMNHRPTIFEVCLCYLNVYVTSLTFRIC